MVNLDSFYQQLKERTGVDLTVPVVDPAVQYQVSGKEQINSLSSSREYERTYKQASKVGQADKQPGLPSLYTQAQKALSGDTLLTRQN
jgi:hypothetical protein